MRCNKIKVVSYIDEDITKKMDLICKDESRTRSSLVSFVVKRYCEERLDDKRDINEGS